MRFAERTKCMKSSEIRELLKITQDKEIISFGGGLPSPDSFPIGEIDKLCTAVLRKYGADALQYGITEGVPELRETLAKRMEKFGINCSEENIIVTNGTQEALELVSKILLDAGDAAIVEVPTYLGAIYSFRIYQADFVTVGMDSNGMKTEELEEKLKKMNEKEREKVKFIYTIPNFHNPAGVTLLWRGGNTS